MGLESYWSRRKDTEGKTHWTEYLYILIIIILPLLLLLNFFVYFLIPGEKSYIYCGNPFLPVVQECREMTKYFSIWEEIAEIFMDLEYRGLGAVVILFVLMILWLGVIGFILWLLSPLYSLTIRTINGFTEGRSLNSGSEKVWAASLTIAVVVVGSIAVQSFLSSIYDEIYLQLGLF